MLVKEVIALLEAVAPPSLQESYDNSGLQAGDPDEEVTGALLTLDVTEAVIREAIDKKCNLVISHHPVIFGGISRIAEQNHIARVLRLAIRNGVHIYSMHTNLDNIKSGVNDRIAERLGLKDRKILAPVSGQLLKLHTYAPPEAAGHVRDALFAAGAGQIGAYSECSFNTEGTGTFRPAAHADPYSGQAGGPREAAAEVRIEVLLPDYLKNRVLERLHAVHPYEEVAYDLIPLRNRNQDVGAGLTGILAEPMSPEAFLNLLKNSMQTGCIRHTAFHTQTIQKVAVCGGSGSFLLEKAIGAGADVFVTADFKYHQFFDADEKITIADIGHYESEQFTVKIFEDILKEKNLNFALLLSTTSTNPVNYYC